MVDIGISSNNMEFPFPKCCMTFWCITRDFITELLFITDLDLIPKFQEVSIIYLQRMRLANKGRYSSEHLDLPRFGHAFVLMSLF